MDRQHEESRPVTPSWPLWSYQMNGKSQLVVKSRRELETQLVVRALRDAKFKTNLLKDAVTEIERELGTSLPADLRIEVLEETDDALYLVLPVNPYSAFDGRELENSLDMNLEDVAQWVLQHQRSVLVDESTAIRLIARAWGDPDFKRRLMTDPRATLSHELGIQIPSALEIRVVAESANHLYLVLPQVSQAIIGKWKIHEEELQAISIQDPCVGDTSHETVGLCGSTHCMSP